MRRSNAAPGGRAARHRGRPWLVAIGLSLATGCATTDSNPRTLHYVDDQLVYSRPPHAGSYEAYLRARVALEANPPRLDEAMKAIEVALHYDPREPQLWTTRAEIEAATGDVERALASAGRALELRPGYVPAQHLVATLGGGGTAATASTSDAASTARQP